MLRSTARLGLVGRGVFYLLLASLAVSLLVGPPGSEQQANANGALKSVADTAIGTLLLVGAALGFAAFGLARLTGAATDDERGPLRRLSTAGQGLAYLALAWFTASFLLGHTDTGSEQQRERTTGLLLGLPGGRVLVATAGLAVLAVCAWQLTVAARGHFGDTLDSEQMRPLVHTVVWVTARVGITARALAYVPVGVFLIVAGVAREPEQADSLDTVLQELTRTGWGRALVVVVAAGFAVFALYSFFEARYRRVSSGA